MRGWCLALVLVGCVTDDRSVVGDAGPAPDAADAIVDAPACDDDRFGAGSPALPAVQLSIDESVALTICPPEPDWIEIDAPAGTVVAAVVEADRPIRLRFADTVSAPGRRAVLRFPVPPGAPVLGVEAVDSAAPVDYRLTLAPAVSECGDLFEPNDEPAEATPLEGRLDGVVCPGDLDVFEVFGAPGALARLQVQVNAGQGVGLASAVAFDDAAVPIERAAEPVTPTLERRLDADGRALVVVSPLGAGAQYRIETTIETVEVAVVERSGRVLVPNRAVGPDGLAEPTAAPRAGVLVDALVDGVLATATRTGADGRWALAVAAPDDAMVEARVRGSIWEAGKLFEVGPVLDRPWAAPAQADGAPTDASLAPALHIAATAADGMALIRPFLSTLRVQPPLRVIWSPGAADACGTCFRPARDAIALSGRLIDPDEWDDAVILHELVHHLTLHHGRDDSPGGAHDGRPVAPALAWSEGFASTLAAWMLDSPRLLDARASGVRQVELEVMEAEDAFGTSDATATGAVSEYLVAAVLWDALDGGDADDDPVTLPPAVVFEAGFAGLATRERDAGAPGMDLLDHGEEMACRGAPTITPLLEARDVPATTDCQMKARPLLVPVTGGYRAVCGGYAEIARAGQSVPAGAVLRGAGPARLRCGAVLEHVEPPGPGTDNPRAWHQRAGAAQLD